MKLHIDITPKHRISPYLFMQFAEPLGTADTSVDAGWDFLNECWQPKLIEKIRELSPTMIRWGGCFALVHRPERLSEIFCELTAAGLEPKRLRLVCKTAGSAPSLLLLDACRGGKPGLSVEAPLILQNIDGSPSAEVDAIYFRTQQEDTQ